MKTQQKRNLTKLTIILNRANENNNKTTVRIILRWNSHHKIFFGVKDTLGALGIDDLPLNLSNN